MKEIFPRDAALMDGKFLKLSESFIPILDWESLGLAPTDDVVHVWKGTFFLLDKYSAMIKVYL